MMYGRGHGTGPAPRRMKRQYQALGTPETPQQQAARVVASVRKGIAEHIPGWERIERWTSDPVVAALAQAMLNEHNDAA